MCKHIFIREIGYGCEPDKRHCFNCSKNCKINKWAVCGTIKSASILRDDDGRWKFCPWCGDPIPEKNEEIY
jgi:hypothetical protein